ncbi:hypothetical protein, partial [Klebsiella pneumoniae]
VIYSQALLYACVGLGYAQALADRAAAVLSINQCIVFMRLYSKPAASMAVGSQAIGFGSVLGAPLGLLAASARPAKGLQPINLLCVLWEAGLFLNRLAGSAPLHSFRRLWAARSKAVMSAQVI